MSVPFCKIECKSGNRSNGFLVELAHKTVDKHVEYETRASRARIGGDKYLDEQPCKSNCLETSKNESNVVIELGFDTDSNNS